MSLAEDDVLFGRIALHYKLVTPDQLNEAAARQVQEGAARRLSDLLVDSGVLSAVQLQKLLAVQQEYIAKREAAARPAAVPAVPPSLPAPQVTQMPPIVEAEPVYVPEPEPASRPLPQGPPLFRWREAKRRLDAILEYAIERNASDIHVHSAAPLKMRINGRLQEIEEEVLDRDLAAAVLGEVLTPEQKSILDTLGQVDFAYTLPGRGRFRSNAYRQQRGTDAVFRAIPPEPPTLASLGLPETLARFANFHQGLVLITGPAGCGKSSTLAAMINIINQERHDHIITVEDPIEYLHRSQKCVVNQRQVGRHTGSFARALRAALREDPDVIALGELRDLETISLALTAAETGHLVLATLHTSNSIRTINRVLGVFPPSQQEQIKTMISESLRAVISQRLVPRADDQGRVAALEVLVCNKAVGNLIRENKTFQIRSVLQTGSAQGMCLLDGSLTELVKQKVITREEAARQADDPQKFAA